MRNKKFKRAITIASLLGFISLGVWILINNLNQSITFFYTPSELQNIKTLDVVRVGGIVKPKSIQRKGMHITFILTDCRHEISVSYHGVLPSLFREKQGIVALGKLQGDHFHATQLLAKHDENYAPKGLEKDLPEDSLCRSIRYQQ